MATQRIPRGFDVNRPYYNELCEGVRPNSQATPRVAWTGLAHTRIDEFQHDPIVIEPGTLVGVVTGGNALAAGKIVPAVMGSGLFDTAGLIQVGETNTWTLPASSGAHAVGRVKPMGVCYQPIYSFILQSLYTNYTRNTSVGVVTDYVIQVPCINAEEWAIEIGDRVCLGTGRFHGIGANTSASATAATATTNAYLAGRYASYEKLSKSSNFSGSGGLLNNDLTDRLVGRCLNKILLGTGGGSTTASDKLADKLSDFTISTAATTEFSQLNRVQTVPGLALSGSGTKGIPGYFLGARCDASKQYWAMTLLIRL